MTNGTLAGFILLTIGSGTGLAGCSDSTSPSAPTRLSPPPETGPALTQSQRPATRLYGVVSDTAFRPLAGARIEIVGGPETGVWTTANAAGEYSFTSSKVDETTQVRAALDGYLAATKTVSCAGCNNFYAYFYLAPPVPPVSIAGDYTLTFQADSACTDLPIEMRTRSYTATVARINSDASLPPDTSFSAVLGGAGFILDLASFYIGVAGNYVAFHLDEGEEPWIVEEFAPNTYVAIGGSAAATTGPSVSTVAVPFDGFIEYCELQRPMGRSYRCDLPVARARCRSKDHRFTLTRR